MTKGLDKLQQALDTNTIPDDWPQDVCRDAYCGLWERNDGKYYWHLKLDHQTKSTPVNIICLDVQCPNCKCKICNQCLFGGSCHTCHENLPDDVFQKGVDELMLKASNDPLLDKWAKELQEFWERTNGG